ISRYPGLYIPSTTSPRFDGPRLGYGPLNQEPLGLLIEGARTNYFLHSVNPVSSSMDASTVPNSLIAPDGNTTATLVTEGSAGTAYVLKSTEVGVLQANQTRTCSIFVKKGNHN